jgi:hypothetical protein
MTNSCVKSYPTNGSLAQGEQFAEMTKSLHGGSRKNARKNKKMPSRRNNRRNNRKSRMSGGSYFTPYADYQTEFNQMLPTELRVAAVVAPLDAKFTELPAIERAAGVMAGGGRRSRRNNRKNSRRNNRRNLRGGSAPITEPTMLIQNATEEMDARLNPQWYTENTVIPNFRGPIPIPGGTVPAPLAPSPPVPKVGGSRRSSRRNRKNSRRNNRKSRNNRR